MFRMPKEKLDKACHCRLISCKPGLLSIKLRVSCGQFVLYRQMSALSVSLCCRCYGPQGSHSPDTRHGEESDLEPAQGSTAPPHFVLSPVSPQLHKSNDNLIPSWWALLQQLGQNPIRPDNTWYNTKKFFIYKIRAWAKILNFGAKSLTGIFNSIQQETV